MTWEPYPKQTVATPPYPNGSIIMPSRERKTQELTPIDFDWGRYNGTKRDPKKTPTRPFTLDYSFKICMLDRCGSTIDAQEVGKGLVLCVACRQRLDV